VKVEFTASAKADLIAIGDWIGEDNPHRAASFLRELRQKCLSLSIKPNRFPLVRRIADRPVRKFVHRGYLIFYFVLDDRVRIARVFHGSRDWASLFGDGS